MHETFKTLLSAWCDTSLVCSLEILRMLQLVNCQLYFFCRCDMHSESLVSMDKLHQLLRRWSSIPHTCARSAGIGRSHHGLASPREISMLMGVFFLGWGYRDLGRLAVFSLCSKAVLALCQRTTIAFTANGRTFLRVQFLATVDLRFASANLFDKAQEQVSSTRNCCFPNT